MKTAFCFFFCILFFTACNSSKRIRNTHLFKTDSTGLYALQNDSVNVHKKETEYKTDSASKKENEKYNYSEITLDFEIDSSGNYNKPLLDISNGGIVIKTQGQLKKAIIKTNTKETTKDSSHFKTENKIKEFDSGTNKKNIHQTSQLSKKEKVVINNKNKSKFSWLPLLIISVIGVLIWWFVFKKK